MDGEERVRRLAARQDGVIGIRQWRACGLTVRQARARVRRGELAEIHRGVFLVAGAPLTFRARVSAALLACGPSAFASHRTSAVLWRMRQREPEVIDVSVVGTSRRHLSGVRVHRLTTTPTRQLRTRDSLRLSSPARAICELSATEPRADVEYAVQEAAARLRLTPAELERAAAAWHPRPGSAMLDDILQIEATNEFTRSWAERRLRKIAKDAGLPLPTSNVRIGNHRPDAVWAEQRLAVAVDGIGTHGTPVAFAQDRVEINELTAAGWRVMRFTAHQLRDRPTWVAVQLAAALRED